MAETIAYHIQAGAQTASTRPRQGDRQLLALMTELSMDGVSGRADIDLSGSRISPPKPGDEVSIELQAGDLAATVFTGEVEDVQVTATSQRVLASDGLVKLAGLDLAAAYEDVYVDFIVKDLLQQAGVKTGTIEQGPKLAAYVLHPGPRALRHVQRLAFLCGADLYTDGTGAANFSSPRQGAADHAFRFGATLLDLNLQRPPAPYDSTQVWGEGAAGSKGADKVHWLTTDLTGVSAKAALGPGGTPTAGKLGDRPRGIADGGIRSGEAAQACADGRMAAVAARAVRGHIAVSGNPGLAPGDLVRLDELPEGQASLLDGHLLRVRTVRHTLDRRRGFVTRMAF